MSKPYNCNCGRGVFSATFRSHGQKWVCLERNVRPAKSLVKCLACGWKWKTRAKWVDKIMNHKERTRGKLTDSEILSLVTSGEIIVDVDSGKHVTKNGRVLSVVSRTHADGESRGTYRFVSICHGGKRKKIAIHRLVWMAVNGTVVPQGYDVDHVRGKGIEFPDGYGNLRLLESSVNRGRGDVSPTPSFPGMETEGWD